MAIEIVVVGSLKDLDGYRELAEDMCKVASSEAGTLRYDWQTSSQGAFRNVDVYADGAAFLAHFGTAQSNGTLDRFMSVVDIERVDVVGDVSPEARKVLVQFGANFLGEVAPVAK